VPDDLVAAGAASCHELRSVVIHRAVHEGCHRQAKFVEGVEQIPGADAISVVAPSIIEDVGLRSTGRQLRSQAFTEREVLEVQCEINSQSAMAGPRIVGPSAQRDVVESAMGL
jgi:hypothetical protein